MTHHKKLVLVAHNIRSIYNVGSLFRTSEGLGLVKIYLTGYTPSPARNDDARLPHLAEKQTRQIRKTALGAESLIEWEYWSDIADLLHFLKGRGYKLYALEQTDESIGLPGHKVNDDIALIIGNEVTGLPKDVLGMCDLILEIPMLGQKESLNVVHATAIALYHLRFIS